MAVRPGADDVWVVKIGGSLAREPLLVEWLRLLATTPGRPIVIVPGGGAFADCVREHQAHWRFDDRAAHAMALLAMAQFGLMLQALCPTLATETTVAALNARRKDAAPRIWLPLELLQDTAGIEASWRVTSDSLAAWVARELGAARLVLVKSCALPPGRALDDLARDGIVDAALPSFVRECRLAVDFLDKRDLARMRALLAEARDVVLD